HWRGRGYWAGLPHLRSPIIMRFGYHDASGAPLFGLEQTYLTPLDAWLKRAAALVLVGALVALPGGFARAKAGPEGFADLAAKLLPAVVNISTTQTVKADRQRPEMPQFPPGSPFEEFFKDFLDRNM